MIEETADINVEQRKRAQAEAQRLINAYHRVFKTEDGSRVLADLETMSGLNSPVFIHPYNPTFAAVKDGQRQVLIHIKNILTSPAQGDNEPQQTVKVETE